MESEVVAEKTEFSSTDAIKTMMASITEQITANKNMLNVLRTILKDSEKSSKELCKLRNKRTRVKTERPSNALPSGITKPVAISDELAKFLGVAPGTLVPRNEVTKGVSSYVKANELSDPENKQKFVLDNRPAAKVLKVLLGNPTEPVTYFNLQRYLKHHYLAMEATESAAPPKKVAVPPPAAPVAETPATPVKKKILVKKKTTELAEEA
jgi:chromatin remodeling complex protein RSC6